MICVMIVINQKNQDKNKKVKKYKENRVNIMVFFCYLLGLSFIVFSTDTRLVNIVLSISKKG